ERNQDSPQRKQCARSKELVGDQRSDAVRRHGQSCGKWCIGIGVGRGVERESVRAVVSLSQMVPALQSGIGIDYSFKTVLSPYGFWRAGQRDGHALIENIIAYPAGDSFFRGEEQPPPRGSRSSANPVVSEQRVLRASDTIDGRLSLK